MPHQSAVTLAANVRTGESERLDKLLRSMGEGVANGSIVDFEKFDGVHFARFVFLEATTDLKGQRIEAQLLYMSDIDIPAERHLGELVDLAGDGIDELFGLCEGYPQGSERNRARRLSFLREHRIKEQALYVNTVGRTRRQIREEAKLRDRLESLADGSPGLLHRPASEVDRAVRDFVAAERALAWARKPAPGVDLVFRVRETVHMVIVPLVLLLLLPLILIATPFFLILLRLHERNDPSPHLKPPPELVQELAGLEDHLVHNPFTAIGFVKPGLFRQLTLSGVLYAINYATRHIFNHENLAGVKTIHFARWVWLDDRRRVIFTSNYDGSLESYMDDFIDKIAFGLNVVFSNGYGYPRTRWLIADGARDELAFKDYLRLHQVPTRVWFSAYGRLTNANIGNNARIRAALASSTQAAEWLQAL